MKVLVITSASAYELAKEVVNSIVGHEVSVLRLGCPVASLMTTQYLAEELLKHVSDIKGRYDYVIVPGLAIGDVAPLKEITNSEVIKGPRYLGDLPDVIKLLELGVKFSTKVPADDIVKEHLLSSYKLRLEEVFKHANYIFSIGNIRIPLRPPPQVVMYEVMIRHDDELEVIFKRVMRAIELGIDIVVLGLPLNHNVSTKVLKSLISRIKSELGRPVGIDVKSIDLINVLGDELDLIMNLDLNTLNQLGGLYKDKAVVLTPNDTSTPSSTIDSLIKTIKVFTDVGYSKIIVDPLLKPPQLGLSESLVNYYYVVKELNYPIMMGFSNVYELIDADTHSVIALLTSIAMELGVSVLLVTEESRKSINAVYEVVKARDMVYRAYIRKSPPVDTGIDLLVIKEKRYRGVKPPTTCLKEHVVADKVIPNIVDEFYFKIYVDESSNEIVVDVHNINSNECIKRYVGKDPLSICRVVAKDFPTISNEHFSYLGYELCKAEIALKFRRSYIQDSPLFS